jgi:hypothetical protein
MASILKPCNSEHFMVDVFELTPEFVRGEQLHDMFNGGTECRGLKPGKYAQLSHRCPNGARGQTIMSDTWMERRTNEPFVEAARGDVLIAGLGIGMVLLDVQDKDNVTSVTVVEKEQEVIDLIEDQLPLRSKVMIVNDDIFTYRTDKRFDTIYFDIWDTISGDNYPEMKKLHRKFARAKRPGGWMSSWRKEDCRKRAKDR